MQNRMIKFLSGASMLLRKAKQEIKHQAYDAMEENIFHNKYVTREEYDNLKALSIKLDARVSMLEKTTSNN